MFTYKTVLKPVNKDSIPIHEITFTFDAENMLEATKTSHAFIDDLALINIMRIDKIDVVGTDRPRFYGGQWPENAGIIETDVVSKYPPEFTEN